MFAARPDPGASSSNTTTAITTTTNYRPTSLESINRPNPIEPHADAQKKQHPLNGTRRDGQDGGVRLAGQSARGNDFGRILRTDHDSASISHSAQAKPGVDGTSATDARNDDHHDHHDDRAPRRKKRANDGHRDLPSLPSPRKAQKRLQIPPTLSGLHQPPPESGILPKIIVEQPRSPLREHRQIQPYPIPPPDDPRPEGPPLTPLIDPQLTSAVRITEVVDTAETSPPADGKPKRNMWSEEETDFLLLGAHRFGVGDWTKIHKCPDYHFNDRTALDLKDRFRVIMPDEYHKFEEPLRDKDASSETAERAPSGSVEDDSGTTIADTTPPPKGKRSGKGRPADRVTPARLERLGITTPFVKTKRRSRHSYSAEEDAAIWLGYHKHAGSWAAMRKDPTLKLSERTPTDIRDRMRNRYGEQYILDGRVKTVKPTDATRRKNLGKGRAAAATKKSAGKKAQGAKTTHDPTAHLPSIDQELVSGSRAQRHGDGVLGPSAHLPPQHHLNHHQQHHHGNNPYYVNTTTTHNTNGDVFFSAPFNPRERDGDELITLDRDILAWATPTQQSTTTTLADKDKYRTTTDAAINPLETIFNPATTITTSIPSTAMTGPAARPGLVVADPRKAMQLAHVTSLSSASASSSAAAYAQAQPQTQPSQASAAPMGASVTATATADGRAGYTSGVNAAPPRSPTFLPSMLSLPNQSDQQLPSLNQWYNVPVTTSAAAATSGGGGVGTSGTASEETERGEGTVHAPGMSSAHAQPHASVQGQLQGQSQGQYKLPYHPQQQHPQYHSSMAAAVPAAVAPQHEGYDGYAQAQQHGQGQGQAQHQGQVQTQAQAQAQQQSQAQGPVSQHEASQTHPQSAGGAAAVRAKGKGKEKEKGKETEQTQTQTQTMPRLGDLLG